MTYEEATKKADEMVKTNNKILYFIMGKEDDFDVFKGFDGRDEAIKNGYCVPRYSLSKGCWTTNFDEFLSGKFGEYCN